jgi:hypothetical protein
MSIDFYGPLVLGLPITISFPYAITFLSTFVF